MSLGSDLPGAMDASGEIPRHVPVLLEEVVGALAPKHGETYVDATFGAGGYTSAILNAAPCHVLALDRDPTAIAAGAAMVERFGGRLTLREAAFATLSDATRDQPPPDGVVLDIGVSSMQIDDPARGFSFMTDGPLDMRMGGAQSTDASAADVVNTYAEAALAEILFKLGEERQSRAIARAIVKARETAPIATTLELARIVEKAIGRRPGDDKNPATRSFQALRIYVNRELDELAKALCAAEARLKPGGRLVVVTFHSLEDRIVKRFLQRRAGKLPSASRHAPPVHDAPPQPSFRIVNQQPLTPSEREIAANPRARSAKLRAAVRTEGAAFAPENLGDLGIPSLREGHRRR